MNKQEQLKKQVRGISFEEYLMGICAEDTHALDDMLPDVYNDWITQQDVEDVIDWARKWYRENVDAEITGFLNKQKVSKHKDEPQHYDEIDAHNEYIDELIRKFKEPSSASEVKPQKEEE